MGRRRHAKLELCSFAVLVCSFVLSLDAGSAQASDPPLSPPQALGSEVVGEVVGASMQWLKWDVPSGCPDREELARRIEAVLERPVDAEPGFSVVATVTQADTGFLLTMSITDGSGEGAREVAFPSCTEAADFVSIAIALAIDPDPTSSGAADPTIGGVAVAPAIPAETASTEPEPPSERPAEAESSPKDLSAPPKLAVTPPPALAQSPPSPKQAKAESPAPKQSQPLWRIGGALSFSTGLLPQAAFGPTVGGGRMFGPWVLWADMTFLPGGIYELERAFNPVSMSWFGGSLGGCRVFRVSVLTGGPCARIQLGGLAAREESSESGRPSHGGTGVSVGLLAGLDGQIVIWNRLHAFGSVNASLPLYADPFVLSDGTLVHQPGFGFQGSLGLGYFF